jgi:protein required for attachment to host cells
MTMRQDRQVASPRQWLLVANAARARCFERDPENNALRELADFVHPASRLEAAALGRDRGGLVHKSAASTQFAPHTDPKRKEHASFAHELAEHLDEGALAHRYAALVIVASNPFLGELRTQLGAAARRLVSASVALDLTSLRGGDLEERVARALQATR